MDTDWRQHLRGQTVAHAIEYALEHDESVGAALEALEDPAVETVGDARALCRALEVELRDRQFTDRQGFTLWSDLHRLISLFDEVYSERAAELLHREGLAKLVDLYDQRIRAATERASRPDNRTASELMAIIDKIARWGDTSAADRIVDAARRPLAPDSFRWTNLFEGLEPDNPIVAVLLERLSDPLPAAGTALEAAFLAFANRRAEDNGMPSHPFDTEQGRERLQALLADEDWDRSERAEAAARALAWIDDEEAVESLWETGIEHPVTAVRLTCAGTVARDGPEELAVDAAEALVEMAGHPQSATQARRHLEALGVDDLLPDAADDARLLAMAEMCDWLAQPNQYGRPPDHVDVADRRTIAWPPTRDTRELWLIRWEYRDHDEIDEGVGLVGSGMPFVLYGEVEPQMPPESIYALHCVWELQIVGDPRAPDERSVADGLALLGWV